MKRFIMLLIVFLMMVTLASAADVKLDWDASTDSSVTGYKIAMSTDLGVTWLPAIDMKLVKPYTYIGVPDDKLVLFKIAAYNATTTAWGDYRFAGYDGRKKPITEPSGPGIK